MARSDGDHRRDHDLWQEDEVVFELARLAAILLSFQRTKDDPIRGFVKNVADHALAIGKAAPEDGDNYYEIYRLVSFSNITTKARVLDGLADYVLQELRKRQKKDQKYLREVFSRIDLAQAYSDYKLGKLRKPVMKNYRLMTGIDRNTLNFFQTFPDRFADASRYLTGTAQAKDDERDAYSAHYACYRYAVWVGYVAKSHFVFKPCSESDAVCRFENYFRERAGSWRNSTGIAYGRGDWIYLLGQLKREHAPKVLALRATGHEGSKILPGILMSKSVKPLVARAVLQRLPGALSEEQIRVADEKTDPEFSSDQFRSTIMPHIRNDMEFRLEDQIVFIDENGKEVEYTQAQMVQFLPGLIKGRFFLRTREGLVPFNPAAHDHYPFNQALMLEGN